MEKNKYAIGIDCGSTGCKGAIFKNGKIEHLDIIKTGWDTTKTGLDMLETLSSFIDENDNKKDVPIVATGYGRISMDFADKTLTEISCHALGANFLMPDVKTVIDIGGQDCKVMAVNDGKVISFQMNDKCAAGTGRFLDNVLKRLDVTMEDLDKLLLAGKTCSITSTCVVFAESEVISLLAKGFSREEILGGVTQSMASRISSLAAVTGLHPPIMLTGGLSSSEGIRNALSKQIDHDIVTHENALYAGAIGAALHAQTL